MPVAVISRTITATFKDGPLKGSSIEAEVLEGRPPKIIDAPVGDGSACLCCLAGWLRGTHSKPGSSQARATDSSDG
jgi:hypothetical protein